MAQLHERRTSVFSEDLEIVAGARVATVAADRFTLDGIQYEILLESGQCVLKSNSTALATATQRRRFNPFARRRFHVTVEQRLMTLEGSMFTPNTFHLLEAGRTVGEIASGPPFTRRVKAVFPDDLPTPAQVFLVWLVADSLWRGGD